MLDEEAKAYSVVCHRTYLRKEKNCDERQSEWQPSGPKFKPKTFKKSVATAKQPALAHPKNVEFRRK
jgi:hypothetical protein